MRSIKDRFIILEIILVVALSSVSIRAFSASFAYDHLSDWVSDVSGIAGIEILLIFASILALIGVLVTLRGWRGGILLYALMLFITCSPSILAFSQKRWFAFSGGEPSWDTSLTLAEMMAEGILIVLGCLVIYYITWFREIKGDFLERGSEQVEADQSHLESHRFLFDILLAILTTILIVATMAFVLRYAIRELINDLPVVVLFVGLGSCLIIMGVLYFYLKKAGIRPVKVTETIGYKWEKDITDLGVEYERYLKEETQSLKIRDHTLADQTYVPEPVLSVIADRYYSKFNRIGWVQWIEWLYDSLSGKMEGVISIEKNEKIVFGKDFSYWSAPSIEHWQLPDLKKRERFYLSSLVATERKLIIRYGSLRKKDFIIVFYKDIIEINETSGGNLSITTNNERIDFVSLEKEAKELIVDFLVVICKSS